MLKAQSFRFKGKGFSAEGLANSLSSIAAFLTRSSAYTVYVHRPKDMNAAIHVYVIVCVCTYIYIYIYI